MDKRNIRGLSADQIKKIENKSKISTQQIPVKKIINSKSRFFKKTIVKQSVPGVIKHVVRPTNQYLTSLATKVTRLPLPENGSFNPGMVKVPNSNEYIMVYRPDEYRFIACKLTENLEIVPDSYFRFNITNCADPRLIWTPDNKLLMVYSSVEEGGLRYECIRGAIIMDLSVSDSFFNSKPFRISPRSDIRQKNWMPFVYNEEIYLIASVCPHIIYKLHLDGINTTSEKVYETNWLNPWMFKEFLRGNTNPVILDDGNFLSTFHTATWYEGRCFYDNGVYLFEGRPPFRVLKCSNRTYLKAEDACEPHFRKANLITCTFPVGMIREDERILISYGDNDSCVKIMETTTEDMFNLMLDVY